MDYHISIKVFKEALKNFSFNYQCHYSSGNFMEKAII